MSLYLSNIRTGELGLAFAASIIYMLPALLIFLLGEKYLIEGISHSAIKG
jgi:multiple sugar transport system permease protein